MTPRRLLAQAAADLQACGSSSPRLDAELLLCHTLGKGRSWLIAHADDTLDEAAVASFLELLARRASREPLAYITGEKEWWSRPFHVNPHVLIPRPETEHLIETALALFPDQAAPYSFCDIGTGSGCIAVTLACEYPEARIAACDISADALSVARHNAGRHGVLERMTFFQGDMFDALEGGALKGGMQARQSFDAILSNPPYIAEDEMPGLETELGFEPRHALSDGHDGLRFLRQLVSESGLWLAENGLLIVETGLCGLPEDGGELHLKSAIHDLAGHLRGGVYSR